jgi:hypothetical protein
LRKYSADHFFGKKTVFKNRRIIDMSRKRKIMMRCTPPDMDRCSIICPKCNKVEKEYPSHAVLYELCEDCCTYYNDNANEDDDIDYNDDEF